MVTKMDLKTLVFVIYRLSLMTKEPPIDLQCTVTVSPQLNIST